MNEYLEEAFDRDERIQFRCRWKGIRADTKEDDKIFKVGDLFPENVEITESMIDEKCKEWAKEFIEWGWS